MKGSFVCFFIGLRRHFFLFQFWIAYLRLRESAKLDVWNYWLKNGTFSLKCRLSFDLLWFIAQGDSELCENVYLCVDCGGLWGGGGSNFVWVMPICTEVLPDLLQSNYEWHIIFKYVFYTNFTKTCTHTLLSIGLRWGDWEVLSVRLFIVRSCCCSATLLFSQHWTLLTDIVLHAMQQGPCYRDGTLCLLCRNKNFVIFTNMLETLGQFKRMNVFLHLYKVGNTPWN